MPEREAGSNKDALEPGSEAQAATPWHARQIDETLGSLASDAERGLTEEEARGRLERLGFNRLPERRHAGVVRIVARQFKDPLIYILLVAAVVSAATQNIQNAIFIS